MVFKLTLLKPILITVGLASIVIGEPQNYNPTGAGCVDPKSFLSCFDKGTKDAVTCASGCENKDGRGGTRTREDCLNACNGFWLATNVGCWVESCWNQVFSCEYQLTAIDYFIGTGLVQNARIPFYPPPDDASSGACSCNLGYVYGNMTDTTLTNCISSVGGSGYEDCRCCQFSYDLSNSLNACPKSDLSVFGFDKSLASTQELLSDSPDKCAVLDKNPAACVTDFGYEYHGTSAYNPLNLPSGVPGKEPLSNKPGNAFTEAGTGALTLDLFPGYTSVITPKPFSSNAAVQTGELGKVAVITPSEEGGSIGSAPTETGGQTGSKTGEGANPSETKSSDGMMKAVSNSWILLVMLLVGMATL